MAIERDHLYGHPIEKVSCHGWRYSDTKESVQRHKARPCRGCGKQISPGCHDPCIAGLPQVRNACCGHMMTCDPAGREHPGYVGLTDGRILRFTALTGEEIHQLVNDALAGQALPSHVHLEPELTWWAGLTDAQYEYGWRQSQLYPGCNLREVAEEARQRFPSAESGS